RQDVPAAAGAIAFHLDDRLEEEVPGPRERGLAHPLEDRLASLTHAEPGAAVPDAVFGERLRDRARRRFELRPVDDAGAARQVARVHELRIARFQPVDRLHVLGGAQAPLEHIDAVAELFDGGHQVSSGSRCAGYMPAIALSAPGSADGAARE